MFFLILVFFTGGASRIDARSLVLLQPLSIITCAIALLTIQRVHLTARKWLFIGFSSVVLLCILHLVPLPPIIWKNLPGRDLLSELDRLVGLGDLWRPLSMTPMNGWHALSSLTTPLAILLLGVQLNRDELYRLLPILIGLGALSGLWGMLQILGDPQGGLYLYRPTNYGAAVGLFANRNHSAVLLACLFPMLAVYASIPDGQVDEQRIRRFGAIAGGIVLVPLILVTGSRSGMLLSIPALVGATLLYSKTNKFSSARNGATRFVFVKEHLMAAGIITGLIFLTIFFSRAEALDRFFEPSHDNELRQDFWNVGLAMAWKYFPVGSGIGSFVETYQIDEPLSYLTGNYVNHAHNDWLEILITGGLPALLILLAAVISFIRRTASLWRRKDKHRRAIKLARLASVLIAIVALASATDYPLRTPTMMAIFSIFCLWLTLPALDNAEIDFEQSRAN